MARLIKGRGFGFARVSLYDARNFDPLPGELWLVEADRGVDLIRILSEPKESFHMGKVPRLVRKVGPEDTRQLEKIREKEREAFKIWRELIEKSGLPMKPLSVHCTFDEKKLIFYFYSEGRVDFRKMVRQLAAIYKTRIELRQVGIRDTTTILGGIGPCGHELCCAKLGFQPPSVSLKDARLQFLTVTPNKISGVCGRLMCCIVYEIPFYKEIAPKFPALGSKVKVGDQKGTVLSVNVFTRKCTVELETGEIKSVSVDEIEF